MALPKYKLANINIDLLLKVREHILKHPDQFDIHDWKYKHPCGTVACIAGRAALLGGCRSDDFYKIRTSANKFLGLHDSESSYVGSELYSVYSWPDEFFDAFHAAKTAKQQAEVAACRIDYFIATGE